MQQIEIRTHHRSELLDITGLVAQAVAGSGIREGVCHISVPHTTAGLTLNENTDPKLRADILRSLDRIVPFTDPGYQHNEGNSAAHIKTILVGSSASVPISGGQLVLGTWQGLFLCEFDGPRRRGFNVQIIAG